MMNLCVSNGSGDRLPPPFEAVLPGTARALGHSGDLYCIGKKTYLYRVVG
jgi:hypothetical protein